MKLSIKSDGLSIDLEGSISELEQALGSSRVRDLLRLEPLSPSQQAIAASKSATPPVPVSGTLDSLRSFHGLPPLVSTMNKE